MACPYFYPAARFETDSWAVPPRLPLGDAYSGECRAADDAFQPQETQLRQHCNSGYGRGACERFPGGEGYDAVRFHIAEDKGKLIRITYVFEKDCWPQQHGLLEWRGATISGGPDSEILRRQAGAFVESYRRRRGH